MKRFRSKLITGCLVSMLALGPAMLARASTIDPQGGATTTTQTPSTSPDSTVDWVAVAIAILSTL